MYFLKNLNKFRLFYHIRYIIKFKRYESSITSKSPTLTIPDQLITEYIWKNCDKWYNKTAVICFETGRSYTFEELRNKSKTLANNLRRYHCDINDTVAIILPNIPEFAITFLGALEAGLLVTTVNPFYTADEIARQLDNSKATVIFTVTELCTIITKILTLTNRNLTVIVVDIKQESVPNDFIKFTDLLQTNFNNFNGQQQSSKSSDHVAILPFSSGTTGITKGVQLTHRNIVANLLQMSSPDFILNHQTQSELIILNISDHFQDVVPVFLPLFHIYGLVAVFLNFLSQGCKLITISQFIPMQFVRLLNNYQPTLIFAVPQIISLILNNPKLKYDNLKCIRTIVSAASPLSIEAVAKFHRKTYGKIDLLQMYGMTETSPLTLMQTNKLTNGIKMGGSGFLIPNTHAKILPLDNNNNNNNNNNSSLNSNEIGELIVKGPQVMQGYHNNIKETRKVLNDNGWLHTGDVGYYDQDQHFFITDRLKELIKVKGFQVAPAELEEILLQHPAVVDCAVIGVPHRVQGEAPKAFVVLTKQSTITRQQLKEFVANRVANYKRLIGGVVIIDQIPRNAAGKVLRRQLREL